MEIESIAFRFALSVTFVTFVGTMIATMLGQACNLYNIILSLLFGLTILSWVVLGLIFIWS